MQHPSRHALQIKHIIKLACRVIDSDRHGRRRGKTMRYQVSSLKSRIICALYRSENKISTHRFWVSYFESKLCVRARQLTNRPIRAKARCFPEQRNVIGEIQQLAIVVLHLHKAQRCFRCKYLDLAHTRLYLLSFLFRRSFHALSLSLVNMR